MHAAAQLVHPGVGRQTLLPTLSAAVRQHRLRDSDLALGDAGAGLALATLGPGSNSAAAIRSALLDIVTADIVTDEATFGQPHVIGVVRRRRSGRCFRTTGAESAAACDERGEH